MGDDHTCRMDGIVTILIKMFDEMVRVLKNVRYISQLKNLIFIRALEAHGLKGTLEDGILKMLKSSMIVLKSIRWINLYYLKDSNSYMASGGFRRSR